MKEFDADELAKFNGENGNPIYIAHDGKVYDVSESKLWRKGQHMNRHRSGEDLTSDMQAAPHAADVLERFPQVGTLKKVVVEEQEIPQPIAWLINRFPFLRRHPHPMTVHFPIVFVLSTSFFNVLYVVTGVKAFGVDVDIADHLYLLSLERLGNAVPLGCRRPVSNRWCVDAVSPQLGRDPPAVIDIHAEEHCRLALLGVHYAECLGNGLRHKALLVRGLRQAVDDVVAA